MKKLLQTMSYTLASLLLLGAVFGAGCFVGYRYVQKENTRVSESSQTSDLKLPGEVEKQVITEEEVVSKLIECSHLTTYSGEYTASETREYTRHMLDEIAIPGTTNTISMECKGIVKVGCDIRTIKPTVNNDSFIIYIAIPELAVLDNYIIWDSVVCRETNNILNPIDFAQYQEFIEELEAKGLEEVKKNGIFEAAEENLKSIIEGFLSGFEDYKIVFL